MVSTMAGFHHSLSTSTRSLLFLLCTAFRVWHVVSFLHRQHYTTTVVVSRWNHRIQATSQLSDESFEAISTSGLEDLLEGAEILELSLAEHRPLGCTVEESLGKTYGKLVFCSKVTPDGLAEKAGIQPGDVFLGVSGMFDAIEDVTVAGIDRVRSLVGACPDDEPLLLRLARGTNVLADHENAIVELCSNPQEADSQIEECVVDFLQAGYYSETDLSGEVVVNGSEEIQDETGDIDDEDILDNMFNMWAEDLPTLPTNGNDADSSAAEKKAKPKPWSSRSSPSGTWVRDPETGKMKNIDA